ncbi:MAG TPA: neuraminidase-like domain-containing protein, partial [Pyrinomonadaceae bacterium]|nr:neuraminidase-like domain-containing protein [Pyrinomonadaceae bacterium]
STVKAKYDEEQWLAVAKPLNNHLRERRKDALIAYILVDPALVEQGITDSNQLFEYFLIDVNMSACFMTSRIKQAVSSVQLFVHRCLLNLEEGVKPSNIDAQRWNKWMKYYRVWEANRKVFLYPENWIEPELRDDKSPFFRELETQLLQNEVTDETVENAFVTYLEKLDEVARLEICGFYWQAKEQGDQSDILHVFGRTFNPPHIYYYRKQRVATGVWTPWEKVNLDIEGDHLIPVIYNHRLQLYWPIFEEKPDKDQPLPNPQFDAPQPPVMHWEIRLAWSEYRNKKWTPKRISSAKLSTEDFRGPENAMFSIPPETLKSEYCFRSRIEDGSLLIVPSWAAWLGELGVSFDFPAFHVIGCNGRIQIKPPGNWVSSAAPLDTHNDSMMLTEDPGGQDHKLKLQLGVVTGYGKVEPSSIKLRIVLRKTPDTFSLVYAHQLPGFSAQAVLFYQDYRRTYLVMPPPQRNYEVPKLKFFTFFHPHVCTLVRALNRSGISVLLSLDAQRLGREGEPLETFFDEIYKPWWFVHPDFPKEIVDFELSGAYSLYNWELFFHTPLLIADRLSKNQRFEEAMKWFHYIFNPTDSSTNEESPQRYWKFLPFHENAHPEDQQIVSLLESLNSGDAELVRQVEEWRNDPFKPHLIARSRITAYQKTVVMKYVDNLIAWGDQLFSRDTIESINEATQLYIMAYNILGPRPEQIPQRVKKVDKTYDELRSELDTFSNVLVKLENEFPFTGNDASDDDGLGTADTFYFCIPKNEKLLGYWDTVADRLFKIRHCMNIEGVVRELPLFEPPIDPALLVKAAAMGLDLSSVMNDINSALPHYRFTYSLQKAQQLCGEVKSLGGALLSALEKKDAEELGVLRASHETRLLEAIAEIKKQQVQQATEELEVLKKSKLVTEAQRDHFQNLDRINDQEQAHMDSLRTAHIFNQIAQEISGAASSAFGVPQVDAGTSPGGFSGVPMAQVTVAFGGSNVGNALQAVASVFNFIAAHHSLDATMASLKGSYDRRWEEWKHHEKIAKKELDQIDKQIAVAEIKLAIAEKELENHQKQIENSAAVEEFLRNKYTNEELYGWMVSQISAVFFQSYKLAFDTAKKAEKAYRYELGLTSSDFIQFGYWDSLRKGLLSGERLWLDLSRLDLAYHDLNKREYELTTHASLLQLDPEALLQLRILGQCTVSLPEELFDLDCPGHYFRRIKSVSVSIPAVSGPYSSVNCTLTLLKSSIRRSSLSGVNGYARADDDDNRFSDHFGSLESIVTSSGQGDSGLFETNLRDERYLPFEGSGAISEWRLELPNEIRQFNYDTISDVIIHLRYTAREGGSALRKAAVENLKAGIAAAQTVGSVRLFSVRHEFPNDWARFKSATPSNTPAELSIELREEHYPFWSKGILGAIKRVDIYARTEKDGVGITMNGQPFSLLPDPSLDNLKHGKLDNQSLPPTGMFTLALDDQTMTDLWLALTWSTA